MLTKLDRLMSLVSKSNLETQKKCVAEFQRMLTDHIYAEKVNFSEDIPILLSSLFIWSETNSGYDFWNDVEKENH